MDLEAAAGQEGVAVAVLVSPGREAKQSIKGDGAGKLFHGKHRDGTKDEVSCHAGTWRTSVSNRGRFGVKLWRFLRND